MFSKQEFQIIKERFGEHASWAIWDLANESNTTVIENNWDMLHSRFVGIGLNISQKVSLWGNFRGGKNDRKLKYAFNHCGSEGFYLTDLIKNVVEKNSFRLMEKVKSKEIEIEDHVTSFIEEMQVLKIQDTTKFLVFGNAARELFESYYDKHFPENKVYFLKHYSSRGTDEDWVHNVWDRLNIEGNFNSVLDHYQNKK